MDERSADASKTEGSLKPLIEDIAWCWWTRPRATRIGGTIYFGALDSAGQMIAAMLDLETKSVRKSVLAGFEDDDHNNPALVVDPERPLVAFYSRHDEDDALRFRRSTQPLDIDKWEPERLLQFGGLTTYAEVHPRGNELHLFTRVDDTQWAYCRSPDWAQNWSAPRNFLAFDTDQEVYMATVLLDDHRTVRMAVSGHPKEYRDKPLHDVWAALIDLGTGEVRPASGGEPIANLITGENLPLDYPALEKVHQTPADRTVNLFDVSDGPVFEIGFVDKAIGDSATEDARYHVTSLRDGLWRTEEIAPAGDKFGYIDAGFYVGGVAFPDRSPGGRLYLTREHRGTWHFERWDRHATGRWIATAMAPPSQTRLTRPWAIANPTPALEAVALMLERYADSYYGTLSHLVGAPAP